MAAANRVLVYGGKGALGSACVHYFKSKGWWVASIDIVANEEANANVLVKLSESFTDQAAQVGGAKVMTSHRRVSVST
ncbi:hypothetical protein cypCar_00023575 [Cyprinus carpio]|nr:hypothetical protein cypCar_00023575 [Cyprinus carpio]